MKNSFLKILMSIKYLGFILCFQVLYVDTNAQSLSINTTGAAANPSALFDVSSANKGILIPRISLTGISDVTTIASPANSLLVYNTNVAMAGGSGTGYYYFNGIQWIRITDYAALKTSWELIGNSGTIPGTNYIGTNDPTDLMFKTNSLPA